MPPEEFEHQVARIIRVLEGKGGIVTWNDRIPDPDNPSQPRQVDVTVKRDDFLTIVECRHHSRPQDVQWIEELYGRRESLGAQMVMGVSSSGFTSGAWQKANRLGVFLRDLRDLTDSELLSWGHTTSVRLSYVHFRRLSLFVIPTEIIQVPISSLRTALLKSDGDPWPLATLFRNAATRLAKAPEGLARLQYFVKELHIGQIPVPELVLQVEWRWLHRDLNLPCVLAFRGPGEQPLAADTLVEKATTNDTEVFHFSGEVLPIVDVSVAAPGPRSFLRKINIDMGRPVKGRGFGLIGVGEEQTSLFAFKIHILRRNSSLYRRLLPPEAEIVHL